MATIQGIYIALFGRPADPLGMQYFDGITKHATDLSAVVDLAGQPEYRDRFKDMTNEDIVRSIYKALFARDAEQTGLDFFLERLSDGRLNINNIAVAILEGARERDLATVGAKEEFANAFTKQIDTLKGNAAYVGTHAAEEISRYLAGVTADHPGSMTDVGTAVIHLIGEGTDTTGSGGPSAPPLPGFTLTLDNDNIVGTSADDIVRGVVSAASNASTFVSADLIDGGAGSDTLILSISSTTSIDPTHVSNMETLQVTSEGTMIAASVQDPGQFTQLVHEDSAADKSLLFLTADASLGLTISNTAATTYLVPQDLTGNADHVALTLDRAGTANQSATIYLIAATQTANEYEQLSINSTGTANFVALSLDGTQTSLSHIDITGSADTNLTISGGSATAVTIDASAATGAIAIGSDATRLAASTTNLTLGSGDDKIFFDSAITAANHLNGGAGSDTLDLRVDSAFATGIDAKLLGISNIETLNLTLQSGGSGYTLNMQQLTGISDVVVTGSNNLQISNWASAHFDASGLASGNITLSSTAAQTTIDTGLGNDTINLAAGAETVNAGAGGDYINIDIANNGASGADRITLGDGADTAFFQGSTKAGTGAATSLDTFAHIEDFSFADDTLGFSSVDTHFSLDIPSGATTRTVTGIARGTSAGGYNSGPLGIQSIATDQAATGTASVSLIKLTAATTFTTDIKTTFTTAMGSATISNLANQSNFLVSVYDADHHQMIIAVVNNGGDAIGDGRVLTASDFTDHTVAVVGVLDNVSDTDYAAFGVI